MSPRMFLVTMINIRVVFLNMYL